MPPSEPNATDVAAVAAHLQGEPAPAPAPEAPQPVAQPAQQPAAPAPQPAPSQQPAGDPFESLFAPLPTEVATPAPQPAPQATEVAAPPVAPAVEAPAPEPEAPKYQTYDEYMTAALGEVGNPQEMPDPSKIAPDDEASVKAFFDDLVNTAVQRAEQAVARKTAIQSTERQLWDQAFDKYGSLKANKDLRDMVHNIRMGHFQKGQAITPTQAADKLLDAMKGQYNKGVADNTVVTSIESTQPTGGGSGQPVATTLDRENILTAVQDGGETALAAHLDAEIKAGRL